MAGGTVNLVTKGGSNDFHGSVYYSGRNDKLDTFDTELKAGCPTCPKNKLRANDYGYTIGGPINKNKVFFFFNQECNNPLQPPTPTNHFPPTFDHTVNLPSLAAAPPSP